MDVACQAACREPVSSIGTNWRIGEFGGRSQATAASTLRSRS